MTLASSIACVSCLIVSLTAGGGRQGADDPNLRAAVDRFFATQQAEDVDGYLALWSARAKRPTAEQLKYVFESGDDTFSDVAIVGTFPTADRVRVRVSATRDRVTPARIPGRPPFTFHSTTAWSLTYVREGDEWKLIEEGSAVDDLADSLIDAQTPEAREALLLAEPDLVTDGLIMLTMALSRRGGQAAQERAYPAAQIAFERMRDVARRVGNKRLEGEALQNLANAMYFQRNLQGALQAYEERLPLERERDDSTGIAAALLGIATIRYSFSEYATALTTYREALAIQERLDDAGAMATTLISTGNVLYLQGEYSAAIADYTRSRDLNRKLPNPAGEADALEGLGRVFIAQGNYRAALEALAGVLADGKARNDRNDQGAALLSIGDVHFRLGNLDNARTALVESRDAFRGGEASVARGPRLAGPGARRSGCQPVHVVRGGVPKEHRQLQRGSRRGVRGQRGRRAGLRPDGAGEIPGWDRLLQEGHRGVHRPEPTRAGRARRGRPVSSARRKRRARRRARRGRPRASRRRRPQE